MYNYSNNHENTFNEENNKERSNKIIKINGNKAESEDLKQQIGNILNDNDVKKLNTNENTYKITYSIPQENSINKTPINLINNSINQIKQVQTKIKNCNFNNISVPSSYGELIPIKNQMNCDAPNLTLDFFRLINLKDISNQKNIGNYDYFEKANENLYSHNNSCYINLRSPAHIFL